MRATLAAALLLLMPVIAEAQTTPKLDPTTASWKAPTQDVGGGPITDLKEFNLKSAPAALNANGTVTCPATGPVYVTRLVVPSPTPSPVASTPLISVGTTTNPIINVLAPAGMNAGCTHVTAVDLGGLESAPSAAIPFARNLVPSAPSDLQLDRPVP